MDSDDINTEPTGSVAERFADMQLGEPANPDEGSDVDDGFGEFEASETQQLPEPAPATHQAEQIKKQITATDIDAEEEDHDDFGDFGEAPSATAGDDDDDYGGFSEATPAASSSFPSAPSSVASIPAAAAAESVAPSVPNLQVDPDFLALHGEDYLKAVRAAWSMIGAAEPEADIQPLPLCSSGSTSAAPSVVEDPVLQQIRRSGSMAGSEAGSIMQNNGIPLEVEPEPDMASSSPSVAPSDDYRPTVV